MKSSQLEKEEWEWVNFENGFLILKKNTGKDTLSSYGIVIYERDAWNSAATL